MALLQSETEARDFMKRISEREPEYFNWTPKRKVELKRCLNKKMSIGNIARKFGVKNAVIELKVPKHKRRKGE